MALRGNASVASGAVRRVASHGLARGMARAEIAGVLGVPLGAIDDPDARLPAERLFDLWEHLARRLDDPGVPVRVASEASLDDLHVLGFAVLTAPTLKDGIGTFGRYGALLTDSGRWHVALEGARVVARFERPVRRLGHRLSNETAVAQFVGALRQLCGGDVAGLRVSFRHSAPRDRAAHRAFFRCAVDFDGSMDGLAFARPLLDARSPGAHRAMWMHLCQDVERRARRIDACDARDTRSVYAAVSAAIAQALVDGMPVELDAIARVVGHGDRTLRRRLADEGTSFRKVVDDERRARAKALLGRGDVSITRAALDTGFADPSAFTHACRRWFGGSPIETRARMLGAAPRGRVKAS